MIYNQFINNCFSLSILILSALTLLGCIFVQVYISTEGNEKSEMAQTGLVVVSNFSKISHILASAKNYVTKTLYISFAPSVGLPVLSFSEHISGMYTQSIQVCNNLDIRVLMGNLKNPLQKNISTLNPIDLVIFDQYPKIELKEFARSHFSNLKDDFAVMNIGDMESSVINEDVKKAEGKIYDYVALGGTFDRLHTGHKILLSQGVLRANKHLTVGVTDLNLIKTKTLFELIEPMSIRINNVKQFLNDIDPSLEYNVVPIQDMYGPTKDDPRLQLLVVSEETFGGGKKVNEKRQQNNLPSMDVYCIELASETQSQSADEEKKISSSNKRMRLLGTLLKEPENNTAIRSPPYVIGLTGGIASGKTKIAERLSKMGAGVINCDLLAHELYRPGKPLNATLAQEFGQDIIDSNGEVDRRKLGGIVFNDPKRLIELNKLVWPAIIDLALQRVQELGQQGYRVVVMEAAVLIQADWTKYCHQVWTSIIPRDEAIKRLQERNGLSEQAAKERLNSQPSNIDQVASANVVFSSLWSYESTSSQVEKAWIGLQKYLDQNNIH